MDEEKTTSESIVLENPTVTQISVTSIEPTQEDEPIAIVPSYTSKDDFTTASPPPYSESDPNVEVPLTKHMDEELKEPVDDGGVVLQQPEPQQKGSSMAQNDILPSITYADPVNMGCCLWLQHMICGCVCCQVLCRCVCAPCRLLCGDEEGEGEADDVDGGDGGCLGDGCDCNLF